MKIGYLGEGTNDLCTMEALRDLWCPHARFLDPPRFRGTRNHKRVMRDNCYAFDMEDADLFLFFRDANKENFRQAKTEESEWIPDEFRHKSIYAVADRNIESWLAADVNHTISVMNIPKESLDGDPKPAVDKFFGTHRDIERCDKIKEFVKQAPIQKWLGNLSFKDFYEDCRDFAQQNACTGFPNLRDN